MNQFRSGTVEEPINVHPGRSGWKEGCSKTCDAGVPISINKDISLDRCECMINVWVEEGAYDLEVSVDDI